MEHLVNFLKGIIVGVANIIPGVSGGTMAVITGVYEKILGIAGNIIKHLKNPKELKKDIIFIVPFGLGAVIGIVVLSKLIGYLLQNFAMQTKFCFLGLILGSLPLLFKNTNKKGFKKTYIIPFLITIGLMLGLNLLSNNVAENVVKEFDTSPIGMLCLAGYGFIAAGTMIVPGVSGSMVMMILGIYEGILAAISSLKLIVLIPFAIGVVLGIVVISKIINMLLEKFYSYTYYAILRICHRVSNIYIPRI